MRGSRRTSAAVVAIAVLSLAAPGQAQILNTLRGFDASEPGKSGELAVSFGATGGNTENVSLGAAAALQWQGKVHRWRLLLDAAWAESRGETNEEASALHLRHNARLSPDFASILFVQHQHNRFQRVDTRLLCGAGVRWDALRGESLAGAVGASPMLEVEKTAGRSSETKGRLSVFVTLLGKINDRTSMDLTTFVQPALDEPADLRAVAMSSLRLEISGALSLLVSARVQYDSEPETGVEETDWRTRTGLSVTL